MNRGTDGQAHRCIGTKTDRDRNRDTDRQGQGHRRTGTGTQTDRERDTDGQGQGYKGTGERETNRHGQRYGHRHRRL
jgi:hypothetical protein